MNTTVRFGRFYHGEESLSRIRFDHPLVQNGVHLFFLDMKLCGPQSVGRLEHRTGSGLELDAVACCFEVSKMAIPHFLKWQ